jgi:hypothetical protein
LQTKILKMKFVQPGTFRACPGERRDEIIGCITLFSEFSLYVISALHLSRVLYKPAPFMQNKPNLPDDLMNVSDFITRDYENQTLSMRGKNKPNQTQFFKQSYQLMLLHSKYLKKTRREFREQKPNQTQFRTRPFFTQSFQLSEGKIPRLATFGTTLYTFVPFQTTFITTFISITYKKIPKKTLAFHPKTHVVNAFTNPHFQLKILATIVSNLLPYSI